MALLMPGTTSNVDAGSGAGERLLAAATEHERVAALEPHDLLAGPGVLDHQPLDLVLLLAGFRRPAALPDVDDLCVGAQVGEDRPVDQPVEQHDVGLAQHVAGPQRQQPGVARAGSDEVDDAGAVGDRGQRQDRGSAAGRTDTSASAIWSRSARALAGAPPALTATTTSPCRWTAGTHAAEASRSSARTQKTRSASASAATMALTAGWSVQACTSQTPSRSPGLYALRRAAPVGHPPDLGADLGATTSTSAPAPTIASRRPRPDRRRRPAPACPRGAAAAGRRVAVMRPRRVMASTGQISTHSPQSVHRRTRATERPDRVLGQVSRQAPQAVQARRPVGHAHR